jgi:hypothetical protein
MRKFSIFGLIVLVSLILEIFQPFQVCWAVRLRTKGSFEGPVCPAPITVSPKGGETVYTSNPILMWNPPPGVTPGNIIEYQIRMSENPSFNPTNYGKYVTGTIHTVDYRYMQDNSTLYWDVRAKITEGWGAWSESAVFVVNLSFLTPPRLVRPQRDALLAELTPTFEWEAVPNATHYSIQIAEDREFSGAIMRGSDILSTTFIPYANLKENTQYYWRVCGIKDGIVGSFSEVGRFRILTAMPPITLESPPNGSRITSITPGPVLSWRRFSEGGGYWVQLSTNRDFSSAPTHIIVYNNFYEVPSGSLEDSKTYYWRVKQAAGTEWRRIDPIWSFTVSVVPEMPWITNPPNGSRVSSLRPTISWNAVPYATNYELELRDGSMSGPLVFRLFPTTTSIVSPYDLSLNKKYVWIIKACRRNSGCSGPSMGWFEVGLQAPRPTPPIQKLPPTKQPVPTPPVKPPVR